MKKEIKNYYVDKEHNEIYVSFNNDTGEVRDYSLAEEKKILHTMKEQVLANKEKYEASKLKLELEKKPTKRFMIAYAISLGLSAATVAAALSVSIWCLFGLILTVNGAVLFKGVLNEYIEAEAEYQDFIKKYEKDIYLIEHSEALSNEKILAPKALDGVSEETQKYIISSNLDPHIPILNLNSIEDIPSSDLEQINDNVEKVLKLK